ncbi:exonuclease SbcCD subunit D [Breznakiellaceae bacterium SP9]
MIKFLHTADLHLGKSLHDQSFIKDQEHMLEQASAILADASYRALLIAGDVYDRTIPPPEAIKVFSTFLGKLRQQNPSLEILIIPGNHDSPSRLSFGKELFKELGLHFITDPQESFTPIVIHSAEQAPRETAAFFLLPFLHAGALLSSETKAPLHSQLHLAQEAAARLENARVQAVQSGADYTVLGAHVFARGGKEAGDERTFLGTAELIPAGLFAGFDYAAFGHLHQYQHIAPNVWYSGSPLAYSFSETRAEKQFLSIILDNSLANSDEQSTAVSSGRVRVEALPVAPLRKLTRLKGPFTRFFTHNSADSEVVEAEQDYLELELTGQDLVTDTMPLLKSRFPHLLNVKQTEAFALLKAANQAGQHRGPKDGGRERSTLDDFVDFLGDMLEGTNADTSAIIELFKTLLTDAERSESEEVTSAD